MSYVFDSNILIYQLSDALSARGGELLRAGLLQGGAYSVISRIEIMGYPQSPEELAKADQLLRSLREIPLNDSVAALAINIRQHRKVKIPDAIVAASAIHLSLFRKDLAVIVEAQVQKVPKLGGRMRAPGNARGSACRRSSR